jgi:hypothetical protein
MWTKNLEREDKSVQERYWWLFTANKHQVPLLLLNMLLLLHLDCVYLGV